MLNVKVLNVKVLNVKVLNVKVLNGFIVSLLNCRLPALFSTSPF